MNKFREMWALTKGANQQSDQPDHNMVALTLTIDKNIDSDGNGEIQIFPDGRFYAKDGRRPEGWQLTAEFANKLIEAAQKQKDDYMVDYEHQTIFAAKNGQPNPAAGWFKELEYREGEGLFAKVKWNEAAAQQIKNDEYRYISPFFESDDDGNILSLFNVGLTNTPAIDGMAKVVALSELVPSTRSRSSFLEQLKTLVDNAEGLSADQLVGAVKEMVNQVDWLTQKTPETPKSDPIPKEPDENNSVVKDNLTTDEPETNTEASAEASEPDPEKYVPIEAFNEIRDQLAELQKAQNTQALNSVVEEALQVGKLLPSQKNWALNLGTKNIDSLKEYLANAQPIVPIGKTQSGGTSNTNALTPEQKRLEQLTGLSFTNAKSQGE